MKILHTKLLRDLRKQPAQLFAVGVLILLGVSLYGASYDAYKNLDASYNQYFVDQHFADLTVNGGDSGQIAAGLSSEPGVQAVQVRTSVDMPVQTPGGASFLGRAIGLPADGQPSVGAVTVDSGTYLSPSDPNGVLVEKHMADTEHLTLGDTVRVFYGGSWHDVTVLGTVTSAEYLWPSASRQDVLPAPHTFGVIFTPEALARSIAEGNGATAPNQVALYYTDSARADHATYDAALTAKAQELGAASAQTRADEPSNAALGEDIAGFQEMAFMFPMLFLGAAGLATYVVLTRRVGRDRQIIGMMRANGYRRLAILRHYLGTGLLVGIVGSVLGALAGVGLAGVITKLYTAEIGVPSAIVQIRLSTALGGIAFGVVVGALSALAPALSASRVTPAEAMRGIAPVSGGGRWAARYEQLFPFVRNLSAGAWLVLRGPARAWRRTLYTELGVILALVLILISWGMIDSMKVMLSQQFDNVTRDDASLTFNGPVDAASVQRIQSTTGVADAEPALTLPVTLVNGARHYATEIVAFQSDTAMHGFYAPNGRTESLPTSGLLVAAALQSKLDVSAGDTLTVTLPDGSSVTAPVAGFVDEPLGSFVYASLDALSVAVPGSQPNQVLVRFAAGVDRDQMRSALSKVPGVVLYVDSKALQQVANNFLGLFWAFIGLMLLLGGLLAFTVLFATMSVNLAERATEIATLRAAGVSRRRLARLVTLENVLVVGVGVIPGLVLGNLASGAALDSFNSDMFTMKNHIELTTFIVSALVVVAVALLAQIPGMRALSRMDLATVVRERSN